MYECLSHVLSIVILSRDLSKGRSTGDCVSLVRAPISILSRLPYFAFNLSGQPKVRSLALSVLDLLTFAESSPPAREFRVDVRYTVVKNDINQSQANMSPCLSRSCLVPLLETRYQIPLPHDGHSARHR